MPAEAHGDEHEVCVIFLVPFRSSKRWEQHKPDLVGYTEKLALVAPEKRAHCLPTLPPHCPDLSHSDLPHWLVFLIPILEAEKGLFAQEDYSPGCSMSLLKTTFQDIHFRQVEPVTVSTPQGRWGVL